MRLACLQFRPEFGTVSGNLDRISRLMAGRRADLVVLPELCTTGYIFADKGELAIHAEEIPEGPSCQGLLKIAAETACAIAAGIAERSGDRLFNSAVLVSPGGLVGHYRKFHLFDRENELFDTGDLGFPVFDLGSAKIGMMICFDWRYPESVRTLALAGADIIAHPANLVMPHCQDAMRIRCLENHVLAATANRTGTEARVGESVAFTGRSQITGFFGDVFASAGPDDDAWIEAEVEPKRSSERRLGAITDILAHRHPESYLS